MCVSSLPPYLCYTRSLLALWFVAPFLPFIPPHPLQIVACLLACRTSFPLSLSLCVCVCVCVHVHVSLSYALPQRRQKAKRHHSHGGSCWRSTHTHTHTHTHTYFSNRKIERQTYYRHLLCFSDSHSPRGVLFLLFPVDSPSTLTHSVVISLLFLLFY